MAKLPRVLLLGNGLNQAFGADSWANFLKRIDRRTIADKRKKPAGELDCPAPLKAILITGDHVDVAMKDHKDYFFGKVTDEQHRKMLCDLLNCGFDCILTTNYSYELEIAALNFKKISESKVRCLSAHTAEVKSCEAQCMLHTFNRADTPAVRNRVYHIHGEARKPNSMVLGHYYYGNLLFKIKELIKKRQGNYQYWHGMETGAAEKSWVDSFLTGCVYILGFGFDQSEMDLWWLLNRKHREDTLHGRVYFYEPKFREYDEKIELLKVLDVKIKDLGFSAENLDFREFYAAAIEDITKKMNSKEKEHG